MKGRRGWVGSALAAALALLAGTAGATGAERVPPRLRAPVTAEWPSEALFTEALLLRSNVERARRGLAPLVYDDALGQAAMDHARNMARLRLPAHVLPVAGEATYRERLRRAGVPYRAAGENIAVGKLYQLLNRPISIASDEGSQGCAFTYGDTGAPVPIHSYDSLAAEFVARWMASPAHRASLLSPAFRRVGVGIGGDPSAPGCGDLYAAQTFAD